MLPVLFHLPGGRPLYTYGAMLGLAALLGVLWTGRRGERGPLGRDQAGNAALIAVVAGLAGARALYVAVNAALIEEQGGSLWSLQSGGLMGVGGAVVGWAAAALYLRLKRVSVLAFGDAAAPALGVFQLLGRIGSYLYGSDFGVRLGDGAPGLLRLLGTFPRWEEGDTFGPPVLAYHIDRYFLPRDAQASLPVHPVQLYGAVFGLLVLLFALRLDRRPGPAGHVFVPAAMLLLSGRFALDYLRADPDRGVFAGFSAMQLGCFLLIPGLLFVWQHLQAGRRRQAPSEEA